ncbi:hypothetical protein DFJ74DRAFT_692900 [Hyaloraphidium curvatum]|nr:hypothetical protein DFJ74DRAFT_692900 [Hyaloraphidium curvatum]
MRRRTPAIGAIALLAAGILLPAASALPAERQADPASLPVSSEGACGAAAGFRCAAGFCCSAGGFCGTGGTWCGAGCQPAFGTCGGAVLTVVSATPTGPAQPTATLPPPQNPSDDLFAPLRKILEVLGILGISVPANLPPALSAITPAATTAVAAATTPARPVQTVAPVPQPALPKNPATPLVSWITEELWDRIFPYAAASTIWSTDGRPFYTREAFLAAVDYMQAHPNASLHGFGTASDDLTNRIEVAAFLASAVQETGDPSLVIPYPWASSTPPAAKEGPEFNSQGAGGLLSLMEGLAQQVMLVDTPSSPAPFAGALSVVAPLTDRQVSLIGTGQRAIAVTVNSLANSNQAAFGLGGGTNTGVIWQPGLAAVSDDGTLYGDGVPAAGVLPSAQATGSDRKTACYGTYCQYGGRGVQQLSYNFNYNPCSLDLFGDLRLVRYPNLIISEDRTNHHGHPATFGFPGPNPGGNNQLPADIASTTPEARVLSWATSLWFWMAATSGRGMTSHAAMMKPFEYGITSANVIVNRQDGCNGGWAASKNAYYRRISAIMGIDAAVTESSIVCPGKLTTR